jgi:hypothetical protein
MAAIINATANTISTRFTRDLLTQGRDSSAPPR